MRYLLYRLTCTATGKSYVGVTRTSLRTRWRAHVRATRRDIGPKSWLYAAIKEHGENSFTVEHIASADGKENAYHAESLLIAQENVREPHGYNANGAGGGIGVEWTAEQREKLSASIKKMLLRPEVQATLGCGMRGKRRSAEENAEKSIRMKAWWADRKLRGLKTVQSPETLEKIAQRMMGNTFTKGRKQSPEEVAKRSAAVRATAARKKLDKRFNRPLWWQEWLT